MRRISAALVSAGMFALFASSASAQRWQTLDVARQLRDTSLHFVNVRYGAGRFYLGRTATTSLLYEMRLRYDEERADPVHRFDAESRELTIGIDHQRGRAVRGRRDDESGEMRLNLTAAVPLELRLELGAVEAELDLGGIPIRRLRMSSGASDSRVRFDAPNPERMERFELQAGAASLRVAGLGNANAAEVNADVGVGSLELDFGGTWSGEMQTRLQVALGSVTLRIPREVGVRVEMSRLLAGFDQADLVRRGNGFYSPNWESAARRVVIHVSTTFGNIAIQRTPD